MSVTLCSIAVSSCSYLSTMLERMLLCNTARRWTTPVLAGSFLPKTGRLSSTSGPPWQSRLSQASPCPERCILLLPLSMVSVRASLYFMSRNSVKVYGYLGPALAPFWTFVGWHIPPAPCCLGETPAGRLRALEASGLLGLSRHCSPAGCRPRSLPA